MAARASGMDADLRRDHPHDAYDGLRFEVPVEDGGDVRARLMVRAREVEQSLSILRQVLDALPERPLRATHAGGAPGRVVGARVGGGVARAVRALGGHRRARPTGPRQGDRPELPELAGPDPRRAGQHHPGLPGDQQELQPLVLRATTANESRSNMFRIIVDSLKTGILTEGRPFDAAAAVRVPGHRFHAVHACEECARVVPDGRHPRRERRRRVSGRSRSRMRPASSAGSAWPRAPSRRSQLDGTPRWPRTRREQLEHGRVLRRRRDDRALHVPTDGDARPGPSLEESAARLRERIRGRLGRSLHVRQVDAGSCNGCELEIAATTNPLFDLERFGIHFVASPRHADVLLVTGPVTRNMEIALLQDLRGGARAARGRRGGRVRLQRRHLR